MKIVPTKTVALAAILSAVGVAGLMLAHAQETSTSAQSDTVSNVDWSSASDLEVMLQAVEQTTPLMAEAAPKAGTFWSAQHAPGTRFAWPPLPANIYNVPVWNLGDGEFLLDDLQINYTQIEAEATASATTMSMSANLKPMDGGFSPDYSTTNGPYLTIAPTGTNQLLITVINNGTPVNYELWMTPVLANTAYPWTVVAVGATGQTNFTVSTSVYPTGFFRAIWDTNGIPVWEEADPNNPGAGILAVFIDNPTNGAVVQ